MTVLDDRPTNGHPHTELDFPTRTLDDRHAPDSDPSAVTASTPPADTGPEAPEVVTLRERLTARTTERQLAHEFTEVDSDEVFDQVRSTDEQIADREVAQKLRAMRRSERLKAGKAAIRAEQSQRRQEMWMARAEQARARILDPARALASDHRRSTYSAIAVFVLLAGGIAFMSRTVHHGLVGAGGTWLAYLIEPLASVLLVVSLLAQFTGRQRDVHIPRAFIAFDVSLAVASLLLNTIPWGLRYGWDAASLTVHISVPLLVIAGVIAWHLSSRIYGDALTNGREDSELTERLCLLRQAVKSGELDVDVTATRVIKYLRANLPGGIGHDAARRVARNFLGY